VIDTLERWAGDPVRRASGRIARDCEELLGGARGLRVVCVQKALEDSGLRPD
jgi:hypothetical protein